MGHVLPKTVTTHEYEITNAIIDFDIILSCVFIKYRGQTEKKNNDRVNYGFGCDIIETLPATKPTNVNKLYLFDRLVTCQ